MSVDSKVDGILRRELGDERRYRKFMKLLASPRPDGVLHFWQSAVLDSIEAKHGLVLPRRAEELRPLLPASPEPPQLEAADVPSWIHIEQLGGSCPVQGCGRAGSWCWYFRARHNAWSLGAVVAGNSNRDPADVGDDSETTFYAEAEWGDFAEDAGYMDLGDARFLIVRELTRLKETRGLDEPSPESTSG